MSQHLQSCLLRNILDRAEAMPVKEPPVMHKSKKKKILKGLEIIGVSLAVYKPMLEGREGKRKQDLWSQTRCYQRR